MAEDHPPIAAARSAGPAVERVNALTPKESTREAWLVKAANTIAPWIKAAGGGALPRYRLSVGWPLGGRPKRGGRMKRIGECFCSSCSKDGTHEIFISPALDDPAEVLATLLHELVHAFVGIKAKHGPEFKVVAERAGLRGKMTATVAGDELAGRLDTLAKDLGAYPHAALGAGGERIKPKQKTRMRKLVCPECGYTVRTTQKWIDAGLPICGPCRVDLVPAGGENSEEDS